MCRQWYHPWLHAHDILITLCTECGIWTRTPTPGCMLISLPAAVHRLYTCISACTANLLVWTSLYIMGPSHVLIMHSECISMLWCVHTSRYMDEVCHNVMFIFGGREGDTSVDSVCLHTGHVMVVHPTHSICWLDGFYSVCTSTSLYIRRCNYCMGAAIVICWIPLLVVVTIVVGNSTLMCVCVCVCVCTHVYVALYSAVFPQIFMYAIS